MATNENDDILLWLLLDSADDPVDDPADDSVDDPETDETDETDETKGKTKTSKDIESSTSITVTRDDKREYKYEITPNTVLPSKESFEDGYCQFFKQVSTTGFEPFTGEGFNGSEYTVSSGDKSAVFKMKETDSGKSTDSYAISVDLTKENTVYISNNKIGFTHEK